MKVKVNLITIELVTGEILSKKAEAFVHVTDPTLSIDPELEQPMGVEVAGQLEAIGWCDVGQSVATESGSLDAFIKIIHAVAPRWGEGSERGKLANVTWSLLNLAEDLELRSIVVPAISVGTLGYPIEGCAQIMIERIIDFTFEPTRKLRHITLCLQNTTIFETFQQELTRQIDDLKQTGEGRVRV